MGRVRSRRLLAFAAGVAVVAAAVVAGPAPAGAAEAGDVRVNPSTDLVDGQEVRVVGTGWRPNSFLVVAQCDRRVEGFGGCGGDEVVFVQTGEDGRFAMPFTVDRAITTRYGYVDCASAPGACVIAVFSRPGRVLAVARLHFDPEGPAPQPPPEIDVDVDRDALVKPNGGAVVRGRVTCSEGLFVELFVEVHQDDGEDDTSGAGLTFFECHGTTDWEVRVHPYTAAGFRPGHAVANAQAFASDESHEDGTFDSEVIRITLQG